MAEFIFDLQRFPDGGAGDGSSSGEGGNVSGSDQGGGNGTGGSGFEARIRKKDEIIFPMFMSSAEADLFADFAYDVFLSAASVGAVPYYNIQNGIVDSVDFSRLLGSAIIDNDTYDYVNLVDANVGNLIEYFTYNSGTTLSLVFDTGAILNFDIGFVSPLFTFANGEKMVYSARDAYWYGGDKAQTEFLFWNSAAIQEGTDHVDNFYVSQTVNNAIFDVTGVDNILLYDTTTSDITYTLTEGSTSFTFDSTEVTDDGITIYFPTGGALFVDTSSTFSPNFYLADGTSYYYNRDLGEWRYASQKEADLADAAYNKIIADQLADAEAAAEKAVFEAALYESGYNVVLEADTTGYSTFPVSMLANTYIYDAGYYDTIYLSDAYHWNVASMDATDDVINITFGTGKIATIQYDYNFSPRFTFADGSTIGYDWYTKTWGAAYYGTEDVAESVTLSRGANALVYQAGLEDTIYLGDAVVGNVTSALVGSRYINLYFDTGAVANVRYTGEITPDFVFADGSRYFYSTTNGWRKYEADGSIVSADLATDELWGDTPAAVDGLISSGDIATDATLSDLVAAPVDNAAVALNAETSFDINAAGGFVAATAEIPSTNKDA